MTSTPQEKIENPNIASQQADVMKMVAAKGKLPQSPIVQKAKEQLKQIMTQYNIPADNLIKAGKMGEMALKDKSTYPMLIQMAVKEGLLNPADARPGFDYRLVASAITAGRIAKELKEEGVA